VVISPPLHAAASPSPVDSGEDAGRDAGETGELGVLAAMTALIGDSLTHWLMSTHEVELNLISV